MFSEGEFSEWMLKGGSGMLARGPSTRPTLDIDLPHGAKEISTGDAQPYTQGYHVTSVVLFGERRLGNLGIDLVVGAGVTAEVTTTDPASRLSLPRLVSNPYRLYPVVDQIADKICATMTEYNDRMSSREKDLVDLVVFATTQDIQGSALGYSIATESRRRKLEPFQHFSVPSTWGAGYAKLSKSVPYCADCRTVEPAGELVTRLIDPAHALEDAAPGGVARRPTLRRRATKSRSLNPSLSHRGLIVEIALWGHEDLLGSRVDVPAPSGTWRRRPRSGRSRLRRHQLHHCSRQHANDERVGHALRGRLVSPLLACTRGRERRTCSGGEQPTWRHPGQPCVRPLHQRVRGVLLHPS